MDESAKKTVIIFLLVILLLTIGTIVYISLFGKSDKELKYGDYTIAEGHTGTIEKYDPSNTVEGYKGGTDKAYYITGNISSSKDKGFTVITFNLYDKDNKLLGTAVSGLNNLKKGKKYTFKALGLVTESDTNKISYYKLKDIKLGN